MLYSYGGKDRLVMFILNFDNEISYKFDFKKIITMKNIFRNIVKFID
jgi:hypothetical protein